MTTLNATQSSVGHPYSEREHRKFWDRADCPTAVAGWQRRLHLAINASQRLLSYYSDNFTYPAITSDFIITTLLMNFTTTVSSIVETKQLCQHNRKL